MTPSISCRVGPGEHEVDGDKCDCKPNGDFTCMPNVPFDLQPEEQKEDDTRMAKRLLELLQGLKN